MTGYHTRWLGLDSHLVVVIAFWFPWLQKKKLPLFCICIPFDCHSNKSLKYNLLSIFVHCYYWLHQNVTKMYI